ncbi:hypothetical protein QTO34_004746 [Cnephaeus nilssonii]|uniref:Uncharacterized protein n=1 Tax=Cnephaeus nilssonii TaxID=3371016 RepID=A0AA40HQL1_CNENI|nr:hypothetical protein QTO34_004746 [Eptesicus nilssonii]
MNTPLEGRKGKGRGLGPGQHGKADGYVLEGQGLEFYQENQGPERQINPLPFYLSSCEDLRGVLRGGFQQNIHQFPGAVVGKPRLASHMRLFGPLIVALPQNTMAWPTRVSMQNRRPKMAAQLLQARSGQAGRMPCYEREGGGQRDLQEWSATAKTRLQTPESAGKTKMEDKMADSGRSKGLGPGCRRITGGPLVPERTPSSPAFAFNRSGELGVCLLVHQALQKPPAEAFDLVLERTDGPWDMGSLPQRPLLCRSTAMVQTLSSRCRWRCELSVPPAQSANPATLREKWESKRRVPLAGVQACLSGFTALAPTI